ncbi:hypothetical protein [Mycobacterium sp.]|uniref:hypothetical protein n=1 Tax=Mycobacterium sp. TaxID=1785 RepID=UPI003C72144C
MIDWIVAAPPAELAPELMEAFSPNIPRCVPWLGSDDFEEWMFRGYPKRTGLILAARPVTEPILEAVQLLEHSELVYVRLMSDYGAGCSWNATRLGLATLADGKAAVRQRIKDRTGL